MDSVTLKDRLRSILAGQKYLLVLDDIGVEQLAWWEELLEILQAGSTGSTVVVTTLLKSVAKEIRSTKCFELQGLNEDECWSLFTSCAGFGEEAQRDYPMLSHIGRSLVNKCYGCPLAIKTLGSMLDGTRDERLWKQANDDGNFCSMFAPAYDAYTISFQNMFHELAQCFIDSAILPENKLMSRDQLVYFWRAQGLIQTGYTNTDTRDIGYRYRNQLLSWAFLHLHQSDGHGMLQLNHVARRLAVDMMQQEVVSPPGALFVEQGRHLIWAGDSISVENGFDPYSSTMSKVRTFLFKKDVGLVSRIRLEELFSKLILVRVLFLDGAEFEELPANIGDLKLLRYLSLAGNHRLELLPESICSLVSLQTLDLSGCDRMQTLPKNMNNLSNLRNLFLSMEPTFVPANSLRCWASLSHLKICNCPDLKSLASTICRLVAPQVLHIHDCSSLIRLTASIVDLTFLKELSILNCENLVLIEWDVYRPMDLQFLHFQGLSNLTKFPEALIASATKLLRHLIFRSCENLSALPENLQKCINLSEMVIDNCPNIATLPKGIKNAKALQVLKILNCPELVGRCQYGVGDDWHLISHIPRLQLQNQNRAPSSTFKPFLEAGTKLCKFIACSRKARGHSGLCISHTDKIPLRRPLLARRGKAETRRHKPCDKAADTVMKVETRCEEGKRSASSVSNLSEPSLGTTGSEGAPSNEIGLDRQDVVKEVECPTASTNFQEEEDLVPNSNVVEEMKKYYCSILYLLPENYEIEKDTLIQLWIAATENTKDEYMELQEAEEWFSLVLNSGYLLSSGSNFMTGKSTYQINIRKINELIDSQKDKESSYLKWDNEYQQNKGPAAESIRHVSLLCTDIDETVFQTLQQFKDLQSLLFFANHGNGHRVKHIPDQLLLGLHNLQALDLSKTQIKELPSSIGGMIRLRYLNLSWTPIEWLPDSLCSLVELQTLKLRGCSSLFELPEELKRLIKLRHLDFDVLLQLEIMPSGIGNLVNLQTLSAFLVGTYDGCKIKELKKLNNIAGSLCIAKLEHVEDADEAREAALYKKEQLEKLELRWTASQFSGAHNDSYTVLENLQPCTRLGELRILCYGGDTFPYWITDPGFYKLARILLYGCENLVELPLIERLPNLKHLGLTKMNNITKIECREELGRDVAFPKLEKLEINEMQSLRVWDWKKRNEGDFTSLTRLIINECPELEEFDVLPHLSSIKHFEIRECPNLQSLSVMRLADSLEELVIEDCFEIQKKCKEEEGEDWYKIKHVPIKNIQELD